MKKTLIQIYILAVLSNIVFAQSITLAPNQMTKSLSSSPVDDIVINRFGSSPIIIGRRADAVLQNSPLLFLGGRGFNGTNFTNSSSSSIAFIASENWTTASSGSSIQFSTTENGASTRFNRMIINHDGKVGIGTTTPLTRFHVMSEVSGVTPFANTNFFLENNNHNYVHLGAADGFDNGILFSNSTHNPSFGGSIIYKADNRMLLQTDGNTRMLIGATGRVGINTTSPDARLHIFNGSSGVSGTPADELIIENNANNYIQMMNPQANEAGLLFGLPSSLVSGGIIYNNASSGALDFRTNNNITQVRIDKTGKVGIGTTSPAAKLDVNGKVAADSTVVHTLNVNKNDLNQTRILEVSSVFGSDQVIVGKNGTAVHEIIRTVINRDMGPILSQNTQYEVFNIPNVDFQSTVTVSPNFNLPDGLIIENARVTAVGQVTVKFYNATSGIVNPVVGDFVFVVIR